MEEIYNNIIRYFPFSISNPVLFEYVKHHNNSFIKCIENSLYSSAYFHLHILYMTFIYIQLLRISRKDEEKIKNAKQQNIEIKSDFELSWIGMPSEEKDFLKNPNNPFSFSKIKEKTVFRFFRLIGFNDGSISNFSELIDKRNNRLHANGEVFFKNEEEFEQEVNLYINKIETIIEKQKDFLDAIYNSLVVGYENGFEITQDEIDTNFADQYYFSEYELKFLSKYKNDIVSKFIVNEI